MVVVDFHVHVAKHGMWNPWVHEYMKRVNPNVYRNFEENMSPKNFLRYFPDLEGVADKVVFGSDWPGVASIRANVEAIRRLPLRVETKRKILGENARRLLRF